MRALRVLARRLAATILPSTAGSQIDEELHSHIQLQIDDNLRLGMSPDEARRQALVRMGGVQQVVESYRDQQTLALLESFMRDARYGVRMLVKAPMFSISAILVLGLGIGANTAIFSVVNAVMLKPLPYPDADRIVNVWQVPPSQLFGGQEIFAVSPANYLDWRAQSDVFQHIAVLRPQGMNVSGDGEPTVLTAARVSAEFFNVLGIRPLRGRTLGADDERPGREAVAMLSERLWVTRFGRDPHIVGRTIRLDGAPYTVVGIVPRDAALPEDAQLWVPLIWTPEERAIRSNHSYMVVARLKPSTDLAAAQSELRTISRRLEQQYPADNTGWSATAHSLHEDMVGDVRPALLMLGGAVLLVVLIACANLANLLLARTIGRAQEIAIRAALGARRRRIVRQLLTESLLLGCGGALLGVAIGHMGLRVIVALGAQRLPRAGEIALDLHVLTFTAVLGIVTGVLSGALPAWRFTRRDSMDALRQREGTHHGQQRVRNILVAAEVALAMVLLVGAGLLLRTLSELRSVDAGIDPRNVLTMTVSVAAHKYRTPDDRARFFVQALDRLGALPGIEAAGAINDLPTQAGGSIQPVAIDDAAPAPLSEQPEVAVRIASAGYVRTTRMRVLAGRDFDATDSLDRTPVVLISESLARRFWPNENPIGRHLTLGLMSAQPREVVGVVNDVKLLGLDVRQPVSAVYVPVTQLPPPSLSILIRTSGAPEYAAAAAIRAIHEIDPEQPVLDILTMDDVIGASLDHQRFVMLMLTTFASLALILAAVGIYSVLSYSVSQRMQEIGIRMALGAPVAAVRRMVIMEGLTPAIAGLVIGAIGAIALGGAVRTLLYGVTSRDTVTIVAVSLLILFVAVLATAIPARRATTIDPMLALRAD